jgi:hypothetical protein
VSDHKETTPPISDAELDAILQEADHDLTAGLERVTDTTAGYRAIIATSYAEARAMHPAAAGRLAGGA